MEDLFSTTIAVNGQNTDYKVFFDNERYTFQSGTGDGALSSFSLKREHDEWHELNTLPPDLKRQAVDALEKYLLQQH